MKKKTRRSLIARPYLEQLESRWNPSLPVALAGSPYALPGAGTTWNYGGGPPWSASPLVADLDGDGKDEVITVGGNDQLYAWKYNSSTGGMYIDHQYLTGQTGSLGAQIESTPIVVTLPSGPAIFAGSMNGFVFGWNAQTGAFLPGWPRQVPAGNTSAPNQIIGALAAGDLQGTGIPDIVVPSFNHEITAFTSTGAVLWQYNNDDTVLSGIAIGDLNNDGQLDVVVGGDSSPGGNYQQGGHVTVLSSDGKRIWDVQTPQVEWTAPVLADLQNNGKLDVVIGTGYFYTSANGIPGTPAFPGNEVLAYDPNGNLLPGWPYITGPNTSDHRVDTAPAVADLTGSGQLDVIVSDGAGNISAIGPNGVALWVENFQPINLYSSPIVADVTGSGKPDVIISGLGLTEAFDGATGTVVWSTNNPGQASDAAAAVGQFIGDGSYQLATVSLGVTVNGVPTGPSDLDVYNLGTSTLTPPWPQLRKTASADVVVRSESYVTSLITDLYNNALGRAPGASDLATWVPIFQTAETLAGGSGPIYQIVASYEARSIQITSWYATYLGRAVDPSGLTGWENFLAAGQSYAAAQANILGSPENFSLAGGTNTLWVTYLYKTLLGRAPDTTGLNAWVSDLNKNLVTRSQVALNFLTSPEKEDAFVASVYQKYVPGGLKTPPVDDLAQLAWDLTRGVTEEQAITAIMVTQGDYVSVSESGSFIRAIYNDELNRAPTPAETASWIAQMQAGMTFNQVAYTISHSEEHDVIIATLWFERLWDVTPTAAQVNSVASSLAAGQSQANWLFFFVESNQYWARAGSTVSGFISTIFTDLFGRPPTPSDYARWESDPNPRSDLAQAILFGAPAEFYQSEVNFLYKLLLRQYIGTPPDSSVLIPNSNVPATAQSYINVLAAGVNVENVEAAILSSPAYLDLVVHHAFWAGNVQWPPISGLAVPL